MPDIQPFRGLRYAPSAIPDLGAVLCPPYDVISAAEREWLAGREPHNAVHLELPLAPAGGDPYAAAAATLEAWIADGTLQRDDDRVIYVHEQRWPDGAGGEAVARSFFCRLGLEDYGPASGVRPHERTMSGPKEDRFRLLCAVRANLSPVLLLYDDGARGAASAALLDELTAEVPAVAAMGPTEVSQRLWLADPSASPSAARLMDMASQRPLTIADGHHRYETALRYRAQPDAPPSAGWALALLYDAYSGGLGLRPWHRLIAGPVDVPSARRAAAALFDATPVAGADELLAALDGRAESHDSGRAIGMWTRAGGVLLAVDARRAETLDVDVVSATLPQMIGHTAQELSAAGRLSYVGDANEAVSAVDEGRAEVCLLLRPTPVESVLSVAAAAGFMPAKSTYFHPKAATGLVFNPLFE